MKSFLPRLLATITRHPRYDCQPKWDKNIWIVNIFRLWEMIFGRRIGIRAEIASSLSFENNQLLVSYEIYTFEALLAYCEITIREFLKTKILPFKLVSYEFAIAKNNGNSNTVRIPWVSFAIALDTSTSGVATVTSPLTWAHTCTGSNLILLVGAICRASVPTISTPTYNSISMTLAGSQRTGVLNVTKTALYFLLGPSTGSNTISVGFGGTSPNANGGAVSWSGVAQSGQPDAVNGSSGTSSSNPTTTVTTVANNCWVAGVTVSDSVPTAVLTQRWAGGASSSSGNLQDTNAVKTPAGAQVVNWTAAASSWGVQGASFSPAGSYTAQFMPFFYP